MKQEKVVITGGSGLVGMQLTKLLKKEGFNVVHLSRTKNSKGNVKVFLWDYKKEFIENGALDDCQYLIHLAGAGIADERWTFKRKKILIESRVDSSTFLCKYVRENKIPLKSFITSSGINYYPSNKEVVQDENSAGDDSFLSRLVFHWEKASLALEDYCSVSQIRTSAVLDKHGGALNKIAGIVKLNFGSPIGTGKQWMPWIHHEDLCRIYLHVIKNDLSGPYNAVSDEFVNNADFTKTLAMVLKKRVFVPKVPASIIKSIFGEMSIILLGGVKASNAKIKATGFEFTHTNLQKALAAIYSNK